MVKLEIQRYALHVVPETPQDEAFLEEVLGLRRPGDSVPLSRRDAIGLSCWAYADARKPIPKEEAPRG